MTIRGSIARRAATLSVRCEVRGDLSKVSIPVATTTPRRTDRLWEGTCLELFLGAADSGEYWEFNLSPSGDWNVYRFDGYRAGMREETGIRSLPFDVGRDPVALTLTGEFDLGKIVPAGKDIAAGVTAVVVSTDGGKSHWAIVHPASRPDFHRRDGFALILSRDGKLSPAGRA